MFHPIKSLKAAYAVVIQTLSNSSAATAALKAAVEANTSATAALLETARKIHTATTATQSATAYLAAAERHSREQAGQRHEF